MSNFPIQKQTYNPMAVDESISQFNEELNDEVVLNQTLNQTNSDEKIAEATQFLTEYGEKINKQFTTLDQLDKDIRSIVAENEEMQQQDIAFDELMKSEQYIELADKMSSIKQKIASLDSFLVEHQRKGRPQ